jgi:hypothetical protein
MSSGSFRARLQPLRSTGAGPRPQTKPLMMEGEPTAAVIRSRSPRHRNCGVRARDQAARKKGLHQHTPIGPLLAPDNPSAFACAAPWRQQRSREPLPCKPAIPAAEGSQRAQTFGSSGPGVRVRGTAHQSFERYIAPGVWATTAGGRIAAENFYQHAERYFRINNASALTTQPPPTVIIKAPCRPDAITRPQIGVTLIRTAPVAPVKPTWASA